MTWTFRQIDPLATKNKIDTLMSNQTSVVRQRGGNIHNYKKNRYADKRIILFY